MHQYKYPRDSEIQLGLLMQPEHANHGGDIFGGYLLSLMDQAAFACACKHTQAYCVTASVNTVNFRTPINVGDFLTLKARVNYTGKTSLVIGMRVEAENLIEGTVRHSNSSYFTMVAKDSEGRPTQVPGLILEEKDDIRRFVRAYERREDQKRRLKRFDDHEFALNDDILSWCNTQNVQIKL